jgi:hypothetical protein
MNTNELREEISTKLNPAMYRQMFTPLSNVPGGGLPNSGMYEEESPSGGKYGKLISEIPEEDEESGSALGGESSEEESDNEDEESK